MKKEAYWRFAAVSKQTLPSSQCEQLITKRSSETQAGRRGCSKQRRTNIMKRDWNTDMEGRQEKKRNRQEHGPGHKPSCPRSPSLRLTHSLCSSSSPEACLSSLCSSPRSLPLSPTIHPRSFSALFLSHPLLLASSLNISLLFKQLMQHKATAPTAALIPQCSESARFRDEAAAAVVPAASPAR